MKSILLSIKPKYVAAILNGEKTIEIRKTMPKCELPIDVYIYCTKDKSDYLIINKETKKADLDYGFSSVVESKEYVGNGKVVAKFTLNKVEQVSFVDLFLEKELDYHTEIMSEDVLLKKSCLQKKEIERYLYYQNGYAWYIEDLFIFLKPKELSEFNKNIRFYNNALISSKVKKWLQLTKAPQSWGYIDYDIRRIIKNH